MSTTGMLTSSCCHPGSRADVVAREGTASSANFPDVLPAVPVLPMAFCGDAADDDDDDGPAV